MTSSNSPLLINNKNLVSMKELDNSSLLTDINLSDSDFESYICFNLATQTSPGDLSSSPSSSLSVVDSSLNNTTIISNNDTILVNENFAMKLNYASATPSGFDDYHYTIGDNIPVDIELYNSSVTLYDSNLKIDISLNQDTQYTAGNEWSVDYDRANIGMNYFSCINSHLQDVNSDSPFYIVESEHNIYALGNMPGINVTTDKYFTRDTSSITDNSGILVPQIISSNTLEDNFCGSYVANKFTQSTGGVDPYEYTFDEFNSFKIVQATPHVNASLKNELNDDVNGSVLPVKFNGVDINSGTFDFSGVFLPVEDNPNHQNIGNGFQITLSVGFEDQGGYSLDDPNTAFTIDDSALTSDVTNPYLKIDHHNSLHAIHIDNGNVTPESDYSTANGNYIIMGTEAETLETPYNATHGFVKIYVNPVDNRVFYSENGGVNSFGNLSKGTKSALTNKVDIIYNDAEKIANSYDTSLYEDLNSVLLTTEDVKYYVKVLGASTAITSAFSNEDDNRNLATDNSAVLVISSATSSVGSNPNISGFQLMSNLPVNTETIQILSIKNNSILSNQTQLLDPNGNSVTGTSATVLMQDIDLSGLLYSDYRIKLDTKTVTEISNLAQLTGDWSFTTTDPAQPNMVATPLKTSVLYDDYLFMTNDSGLDISMSYAFEIANPIITSTQAIKHRIKIEFKDLADNTNYSSDTTTFYLDDQDITITEISSDVVEDPSCTNIVASILNNGTYLTSNYIFKKYTTTRTFTATFDSKFPFYTNLLFQTPTITEQSVYYKIYDTAENEQPSYLLKYFKCDDDDHLLSNVHVSLPDGPYETTFLLTPEICSVFDAELLGKNFSEVYVHVNSSSIEPLDPFFKQTTTITGVTVDGTSTINVKFNNGIYVNKSYYYIETQNAPGVNISLSARKYVYTIESGGNELDSFSPYNNFYNNLSGMIDVNAEVTNDEAGNQTVTIYDTNGTSVLAVVNHPSNFINNYNIIVCLWPFFQVDGYYSGESQFSKRLLAINNKMEVDNGVYFTNNSPVTIGQEETFNLMTDAFKLRHVDDNDYPNNIAAYNDVDGVPFTESNISTPLICGDVSENNSNHSRSVNFERLRGWERYTSGLDYVRLRRTVTQYRFIIDISSNLNDNETEAEQLFPNIYVGITLDVNAVVGDFYTYDLGLLINPTQSMIAVEDDHIYTVYASVADYLVNIDSNPFNPNIIGILRFGYITDDSQVDLFYPYISGVKASCIKSYGTYTLSVERNIPDLEVFSLTVPNFVGDPTIATGWTSLGTIDFNIFAWRGYVASNLNVYRHNTHIIFYNNYESYYVIAPPVISIYGYKYTTSVSRVPIHGITSDSPDYTPTLFRSFDIDNDVNNYVISPSINAATTPLTFSQPSPVSFASYLNDNESKYSFEIQGNYIRIAIYNGGVGNYGTSSAPNVVDAPPAQPFETIYPFNSNGSWALINEITSVTNVFDVTQDASLNYNISYNQILPGVSSHNATQNIFFTIGNAFNGIPPAGGNGYPSMYLRLQSSQGTNLSFYQANIVYNDESGTSGYYMTIDKYTTDSNVNYNSLMNGSIREVFFPVASHYTKNIPLSDSIIGEDGTIMDQSDFIDSITLSDIVNTSWDEDEDFTLQYIGLTISGLSTTGVTAMGDLLKYNSGDFLQSKALYVRRQDIIRVLNAIGSSVYRVTNGGNVISQRIITSAVSLYYPPSVAPESLGSSIGGSTDIITLFAQNALMDNTPL